MFSHFFSYPSIFFCTLLPPPLPPPRAAPTARHTLRWNRAVFFFFNRWMFFLCSRVILCLCFVSTVPPPPLPPSRAAPTARSISRWRRTFLFLFNVSSVAGPIFWSVLISRGILWLCILCLQSHRHPSHRRGRHRWYDALRSAVALYYTFDFIFISGC